MQTKEVSLPGTGRKAVVSGFLGKHVMEAQKIAGTESEKVLFAMIAQVTTIDDKPVLMEELLEMDGFDVLALMGAFGANFTPRQNS